MIYRVFTSDEKIKNEIDILLQLFDRGLSVLHLRKKKWSIDVYRKFLQSIPKKYHKKIIIHDHIVLLTEFDVGGFHLSTTHFNKIDKNELVKLRQRSFLWGVSTSAHSFKEIDPLFKNVDHLVVGPVFTSISKTDYHPTFEWNVQHLSNADRLIAIGGMSDQVIGHAHQLGFNQLGFLGYIWMNDDPVKQFDKLCLKMNDL